MDMYIHVKFQDESGCLACPINYQMILTIDTPCNFLYIFHSVQRVVRIFSSWLSTGALLRPLSCGSNGKLNFPVGFILSLGILVNCRL